MCVQGTLVHAHRRVVAGIVGWFKRLRGHMAVRGAALFCVSAASIIAFYQESDVALYRKPILPVT